MWKIFNIAFNEILRKGDHPIFIGMLIFDLGLLQDLCVLQFRDFDLRSNVKMNRNEKIEEESSELLFFGVVVLNITPDVVHKCLYRESLADLVNRKVVPLVAETVVQ